MRRSHVGALAGGAVVLLAASCQLVAGVRNDGELETDATSSSSTGGGTSSSTDASTSSASTVVSSSSSSMQPMCGGYPCDDTCVDGTFCVSVHCTPGAPFDVFTAAELQGHALANTLPSVFSNGDLVVAVVDAVTNELLVRAIHPDGTVTATVAFPLGAGARFEQARFGATKSIFQGRMGGEIGEVRVSYALGDPAPHDPVFVSFGKPAVCTASEEVERVRFTFGENDEVSYVANCNDPGTSYKLVMGGETTPAKLLGSDVAPTAALKVDAYQFSKGFHVILTGDGREGEQPHFRGGKSALALATAKPLRLSADAAVNPARLILATDAAAPNDFLYVGLDLDLTPAAAGKLWTGTFEDPATLGGALPLAGFTEIASLDGTTTKNNFGTPSEPFAATSGGVIATIVALDGLSLKLAAVNANGVAVAPFEAIYAATGGQIHASTVGYDGFVNLVAWIEETGGMTRVRAVPVACEQIVPP